MDGMRKDVSWCRLGVRLLVIWGMIMPAPMAWAQLADVDPALHAAVEALVASDPEVANDPELASLCRDIAEATVLDPRERAAVTQEVVALQREGTDLSTVIPEAVRDTARERFTQHQGEMREQLERLRTADPEKAREVELMMREGERQMQAFESGERYTPSAEMMEHARDMFGDWKEGMLSQGAPPEMVARAEYEFTRWTSGTEMGFGGPGREMMMGGPGHVPSVEQMQAMGMTNDQIKAAQQYTPEMMGGGPGHMPTMEQMQAMGMTQEQIQMAMEMPMGGGSNYGINPATGGWEPGMGGGPPMGGGWESAQMPAGWAHDQSGNFHFVGTEGNYGINPATGGWEPGMGGGTTYGGGMTDWSAGGGGTYVSGWEGGSNYGINPATGGWEPNMGGTTYTGGWDPATTSSSTTELKQDLQNTTTTATQEHYETATHVHEGNVNHEHSIHVHTDATRHDHTATSSADTAPGSVYIP